MERKKILYDGDVFEEGELVLVNGKELMYCRIGTDWYGRSAIIAVYAPRYKRVYKYEPLNDNIYAERFIRSVHNGDKIEHVYDVEKYNAHLPEEKEAPIVNGYLIDGWVICIILMIATLILKPVGAWSLTVLGVWLVLRHEEIERIKSLRR